MNRVEGLFGYRPQSVEQRLDPFWSSVSRYTGEGGDRLLAASARVSLADEILGIELDSPDQVLPDTVAEAINQLMIAATEYDGCDKPLEGWRLRARVLKFLQEFGRDSMRYRFAESIGPLKKEMERFADEMLTYGSSISRIPRYVANQKEVLATNASLRVSDGGEVTGNGSSAIGV